MSSENDVQKKAQEAIKQTDQKAQIKQMILWFSALIVGDALGWLNIPVLNDLFNFVATVFTRLFQFVAVPTIALAVITTLATLGT
ncbi:MAG: dicarboxylate/amino acid:cation symporter, partial [Anaerovibrio sp.]|nr:dicarboxylate/amino acid:cation symporter [Anaerovibrio sp.]